MSSALADVAAVHTEVILTELVAAFMNGWTLKVALWAVGLSIRLHS